MRRRKDATGCGAGSKPTVPVFVAALFGLLIWTAVGTLAEQHRQRLTSWEQEATLLSASSGPGLLDALAYASSVVLTATIRLASKLFMTSFPGSFRSTRRCTRFLVNVPPSKHKRPHSLDTMRGSRPAVATARSTSTTQPLAHR